MNLFDRIGIDVGRKLVLEDAVEWAAEHGVRSIDIQLDTGDNALGTISGIRGSRVRALCEKHGVILALHTASAVNVGEYAPYVGDAVEAYLKAYVDAAVRLGAKWIVMHAGFHFTADKAERMKAGRERLQRVIRHAENKGALILLENLNKEPDDAEVHYLAHTAEEWRYYFAAIDSANFKLSFTANHAHLVPEGIDGFIDAIDLTRVAEVRLADCFRNGYEAHLRPGEGDLDLGHLFRRLEGGGFTGRYTNAFGSLDDMLAARRYLVEMAKAAGVRVD
ncbi:MAG TPA: sugar phosphate isomerase/epimerase family protein [Stellaceae bacterium]|nr:sugar phosphate isomerase/epimerase family protein [Stellaceae bacterium]